jgi:hypothetical protein
MPEKRSKSEKQVWPTALDAPLLFQMFVLCSKRLFEMVWLRKRGMALPA